MIDKDIWTAPQYKNDIDAFRASVRRYWRSNVKNYFSRREKVWGKMDPKINHRFFITPFSEGNREPRLQNALVINWTPASGHITVSVAPIMVKSVKAVYTEKLTKGKYGNFQRASSTSPKTAVDLITLLSKGTRTTPKRYVVSKDIRMKGGSRAGTTGDMWREWFDGDFLAKVDKDLERLANKVEIKVADNLVEEF